MGRPVDAVAWLQAFKSMNLLEQVMNGTHFQLGPNALHTWGNLEQNLLRWVAANPASTTPAMRELLHLLDSIQVHYLLRPRTPPKSR